MAQSTQVSNAGFHLPTRGGFGNGSLLDRKAFAGARTSTPASDAVDSSEDERETPSSMSMSFHSVKSMPNGNGPQRRSSWVTEVAQSAAKQRKFSTGGASYTSSGSQPTTPLGENGPFDTAARSATGNSHIWSNQQIWSAKNPTSRLMEVMPSPTSVSFPEAIRSPTAIANAATSSLPFEIPLEPSRKTVRSQSYSAGQLEKAPGVRPVAHRPSRPSMLNDGSRDMLGSLREDEGDDENHSGSENGYKLQMTKSLQLTQPRGNGFGPFMRSSSPLAQGLLRTQSRNGTTSFSQAADYAVADEADENNDGMTELGRQMVRNVMGSSNPSSVANLNNMVRRAQWQTSLAFEGVVEDGNQSRRHSFAAEQLPSRTRDNSLIIPHDHSQQLRYGAYINNAAMASPVDQNGGVFLPGPQFAEATYFNGGQNLQRGVHDSADGYNPFALPNVFSRPQRILYLVVFKCSRADIYYIPENTGLQVKAGDTVIVEGDRGQDLGKVEAINITMEQAKTLKEDYLRKQYKCLMMFSRMYPHIAAIANDDEQFENAITESKNIHGMQGQPPQDVEPRPKMIKRVARPDEVHLLREKEGNEAKAKRVCQTKVNDHGLRMEILDAEFQHDYRKLTFFYYAEEYINFNDLVTDLFKVYKTRIWMSAINPAAFHGANNPHTGQRGQQWPRQGVQAMYGMSLDNAAPAQQGASPERETSAARGNREYERLFGSSHAASMNLAAGAPQNFGANMPVPYVTPPRPNGMSFSPNANQFTPFANQFGNLSQPVPWTMNAPYGYVDQATNYAVSSAAPSMQAGANPQATTFAPRAGIIGAPAADSIFGPGLGQDMKMLNEQFRQFNMNQRHQ